MTVTPDTGPTGLNGTGLTEDDLIQLDEDHSIDNYVTIEGDDYYYRNSAEALFFRDNRGPGDAFYQWDFIKEQGDMTLSISKWGGPPLRGGLQRGHTPRKRHPVPGRARGPLIHAARLFGIMAPLRRIAGRNTTGQLIQYRATTPPGKHTVIGGPGMMA